MATDAKTKAEADAVKAERDRLVAELAELRAGNAAEKPSLYSMDHLEAHRDDPECPEAYRKAIALLKRCGELCLDGIIYGYKGDRITSRHPLRSNDPDPREKPGKVRFVREPEDVSYVPGEGEGGE